MSADDVKTRNEKRFFVFFLACVAAMILSLVAAAVTKRSDLSARIFICIGWCLFAAMNAETFYFGEFRWKGGRTLLRKTEPMLFYLSAIPFLLGSMSLMTFLLIKALFAR